MNRQAIEKTVIWFVLIGGLVYWNTGMVGGAVLVATFFCLLGCFMSAFMERHAGMTMVGVYLGFLGFKHLYQYLRPWIE